MTAILSCKGLFKHFGGVAAVEGVDLEVQEGHIHSVIGPNGAGKSTFFNLISGEVPLSAGKVYFKGQDITHFAPHRLPHLGLSRCFQLTNVFPKLTVYENVWAALFARHNGGPFDFLRQARHFSDVHEKAEEIIEDVGLGEKLSARAETLSHGQSRMLEIAITLAGLPTLMLLDEPTQGLAPEATHEMTELIQRLAGHYTILLIEHKMHIVMEISDVISVLNLGQIIAEGTPDEIKNSQLVQDAYLGRLR
ncbi:MAG: ABC transporter ATP-binding protein [Geminicoccaceae bacterium]